MTDDLFRVIKYTGNQQTVNNPVCMSAVKRTKRDGLLSATYPPKADSIRPQLTKIRVMLKGEVKATAKKHRIVAATTCPAGGPPMSRAS
jgi:hypothetical protein